MQSKVAALEALALPPAAAAAADFQRVAAELGFGNIASEWRAAQVKAIAEPETAIRMACVLIESVCKHILDDGAKSYAPKADLGTLFKITRSVLRLDPGGSSDSSERNICSGLITCVQNVGAFRNAISDAHGKGAHRPAVTTSDAKFAVNGAGVVVTFLLERWRSAKRESAYV
jgi:hypothetical protein